MSSSKSLLQGLSDKVKCAREYALLGNYGTSLKYFEVAIDNVDSYIKKIDESSISEWVKVRKALQEEYKIIYNLENQIQKFSDHLSRPPRPKSANMNFVVEKRQTPSPVYSMDDDPFSRASPEEKDPMVWDPPPPKQPISRVRKLPVVRRDPSDGGNSDDLFKVHGKNSKPVSSDRRIAAKQIGNQYSRLNSNAKQPLNRPGRKSDVSDNKAGEKKTNSSTEHDETPVPKKFVAGNPSDQELVDLISRDVLQINTGVKWSDIAGLEEAKNLLHEAIVLPLWMPWYFQGIRSPWAGVLMFGPPGTGKTMLAKAVANETGTTFFNVSVATITSKWRGESEKLIKILFQMARFYAPSTIFIDEIDSLCGQRGDSGEHEASRRVKTELLVQMDGIHVDNQQEGNKEKATEKEKVEGEEGETKEEAEDEEGERPKTVLVLGATNHPWYLDEALRRRLEKRIYIPLPDFESRKSLFQLCLKSITLSEDVDMDKLATMTEGYSNADIKLVCRDAALMGVRQLIKEKGPGLDKGALQMKRTEVMETPVTMEDFEGAVKKCSTSVGKELLSKYGEWMEEFGSK